jgi:uncharacterized membrane protein YbaN (DUF454 family)
MSNQPNKYYKGLCIALGSLFVGLAILGILLPLLPTTPFLLLAAACFAKSSQKFYNRLLNNPYFGQYIKDYREHRGITIKNKIIAISIIWLTVAVSVWHINLWTVKISLIAIAIGVSIYLQYLNTIKR